MNVNELYFDDVDESEVLKEKFQRNPLYMLAVFAFVVILVKLCMR